MASGYIETEEDPQQRETHDEEKENKVKKLRLWRNKTMFPSHGFIPFYSILHFIHFFSILFYAILIYVIRGP